VSAEIYYVVNEKNVWRMKAMSSADRNEGIKRKLGNIRNEINLHFLPPSSSPSEEQDEQDS
jgi:hypothetical protein